VREEVIDSWLALHNRGVMPVIPCQGSVGASGDLAPLAHLCLPLIGEGEAFSTASAWRGRGAGTRRPHKPLQLSAKEGLALINGTQVSTALRWMRCSPPTAVRSRGDHGRRDAGRRARQRRPLRSAHPCGARPAGPDRLRRRLPRHAVGSAIRRSHLENDDRVQDPYCLRCQPQVMGACLDQMRYAAQVLVREANAVTDNPLVFAADGCTSMLSGGNFHAEPVALVADALAVAIAEIGAISERRIAMLVDTVVSRLPPFLTPEPG
jgi:histidine ammonia-lyase